MARNFSLLPRSAIPLLLLLLLALAWLLWPREAREDRRIFPVDPAAVRSLDVQLDAPHPRLTIQLRRDDQGVWSMDGSLRDLVDQESVVGLVASVCDLNRSPAVEVGDWRPRAAEYGLERPAIRIGLGLHGQAVSTLEIGARNPSTGIYYAAFSGRDDLFLIQPRLAEIAESVLGSVRAAELWPGFTIIAVDTLALSGGGRPDEDVFVRDSRGRWWLLPPVDGSLRYGQRLRAYLEVCADRRRVGDGAVRAKDTRIEDFLYLLQQTMVKSFLPLDRVAPVDAAALRIRIAAAGGLAHRVLLESGQAAESVDAWRDGSRAGLAISGKALKYAAMPLSDLLHADAITESVGWSDSLALGGADSRTITARREAEGWVLSGDLAAGLAVEQNHDLNNVLGDLVHFLDNLGFSEVRISPQAPGFLEDSIYTLRIWRSAADTPLEEIRIGKLEDGGLTGLWFPDRGRLLIVPPGAHTFCREYLAMTAAAGS